jgi:hypothetical protein
MMPRQCTWSVNWASGTLRAEGLDASGKMVCFDEKKTATAPAKILLSIENGFIRPDGQSFKIYANGSDAAIILATIADASGNWCPTATNTVTFGVSGEGNYRGGAENYAGSHVPGDKDLTAEGGFCKVAVRSTFTPGTVTVTAKSGGLADDSISFTTVAVPPFVTSIIPGAMHRTATSGLPVVKTQVVGRTIKYYTNQELTMSVELLNAAGKVVERTRPALITAGWHTLGSKGTSLNRSATGNGIYFVRFQCDNGFHLVKPLVLMQ